ncbi:DoxX family protein [Novosphingobium bradum]|uniref:DoxX family protein n=1 Tax=Novosphingobium bradum TaxID=1737444 RepID=A0ABV7IN33_9SPHN
MTTISPAAAAAVPSENRAAPLAAAGRVMLAAIFLLSGVSKIADPAAALGYIASAGLPLPHLALAGAIAVEVLGGLALVAGYRARLVSLALAGFSLVTALAFHAALGDQNQFIHFFKNVAMAGGLLQIAAFGPGRIAIDRA